MRGIDSIAKRDDAARGEPLDPVRVGQRREEADQHRPRRELGDLVGGRPADADDRLGAGEQLAARDDARRRPPRTRRRGSPPRRPRPARRRPRSRRRRACPTARGRARPGARRRRSLSGRRPSRRRNSTPAARKGTGSALETEHCGVVACYLLGRARGPGSVSSRPLGPSDRVRRGSRASLSAGRASGSTTLRLGGSLHDVGKIAVHVAVLRKPGR